MFRLDLNWLRAVAVLLVVLFHFSIPGFSGGFIGVDIFFVISGYLMTKIIMSEADAENFSLFNFYYSRCKRIIPPLVALILVSTVVTSFILYSEPAELMSFIKHSAASLNFISNIIYWLESGYFDDSSHTKWLLHTWSLSVEWQFYIIYPILILIFRKLMSTENLKWFIVFTTVCSLSASIVLSENQPASSFFLLHTRAWEMLAGGLVFLFPFRIAKKYRGPLFVLALVGILYSAVMFNGADVWPGFLALLPVTATMLIMSISWQDNPCIKNTFFQFVGRISYSLYLWHWPIVILLHHYQLHDQPLFIGLGVASSFFMAILSFYIVEKKVVSFSKFDWGNVLIFQCLLIIISASLYVGGMTYFKGKKRLLLISKEELKIERDRYWKGKYGEKPFEKDGDAKILVVGNSWAIDLMYALKTNGLKADINFIGTTHNCVNFGGKEINSDYLEFCKKINQRIMTSEYWADSNAIFLHDFYRNFSIKDVEERIQLLRKQTVAPIFVFGPKMDYTKKVPSIINKAVRSGYYNGEEWNDFSEDYRRPREQQNSQLRHIVDTDHYRSKGIYYIDMLSSQCTKYMKCSIVSESDELLYFDREHLTLLGAKLLGRKLFDHYPILYQYVGAGSYSQLNGRENRIRAK